MRSVLVCGALANKPGNGGEAWVRLSWVRGLERLGCEVWFIEQVDEPAPAGIDWFEDVVSGCGIRARSVLIDRDGVVLAGPGAEEVEAAAERSDLLLNISGNLRHERLLTLPRRRAYLDLDPGYTQVWHRDGRLGDLLERHEHHLTVAQNVRALPDDGLPWRPVLPPVVLEDWPVAQTDGGGRLTTVGAWRGGYGRLQNGERLYGQKAHEFRRLAELPRLMPPGTTLETALSIDADDAPDKERLLDGGWRLVEPAIVAGNPDAFREYVRGSSAELSPAQGVYVEMGCGWFSDRTTRYLASGRPAIVQDTSLPSSIPTGEGLLTFRTPEEAVGAIEAVTADYDAHSLAARRLAVELFDSDRVLGRVLEEVLA